MAASTQNEMNVELAADEEDEPEHPLFLTGSIKAADFEANDALAGLAALIDEETHEARARGGTAGVEGEVEVKLKSPHRRPAANSSPSPRKLELQEARRQRRPSPYNNQGPARRVRSEPSLGQVQIMVASLAA